MWMNGRINSWQSEKTEFKKEWMHELIADKVCRELKLRSKEIMCCKKLNNYKCEMTIAGKEPKQSWKWKYAEERVAGQEL